MLGRRSGSSGATKYFARLTEGSARVSQCLDVGSRFCAMLVSSSERSLFGLMLVADGKNGLHSVRSAYHLLVSCWLVGCVVVS